MPSAVSIGGLRVIDPQLAQDAWTEPDPLTDRERQILRAAEEGSDQRRHRRASEPVGGDGAQLPVGGDLETGREQPHRSGAAGATERVAVRARRPTPLPPPTVS